MNFSLWMKLLSRVAVIVCLLPVVAGAASAPPADSKAPAVAFFVSTEGKDDWSGVSPAPNAEKTEGPFATLGRARDAVRRLPAARRATGVVVQIRGGVYRLSETIVFGREDSGLGDGTLTYEAYPGETPVFSSAAEITGWRRASDALPGLPKEARGKVWVAEVPKRQGASWSFRTLYDGEGRLPRARSTGFAPLPGGTRDQLHFPRGTLKSWSNLADVEIVIRPYRAWILNILPLRSVNEQGQVARTAVPATYAMDRHPSLGKGPTCWVENVLEALDAPGEWVLNTKQGKLYLWPRGEGPPRGIVAPRLRELIRVEGEIDKQGPKDTPVRNLCFRGLTFMHGERYTLTNTDAGLQHDWDMHDKANALLRLRGAENCVVERCHFTQSGGGAIRVDLYGQGNRIADNHLEHLGATGILLCGYGPGTKDVNKRNLVVNNHIHHCGELYWHSPAIFLWQSGENRVAHNLIHHTPYSGIILSGVMTHFFARGGGRELTRTIRWEEVGKPGARTPEQVKPFLHTRDNLIEYNEIHHVMERLGDGNGIYVRGAGPGNVIRRNYIHDLVAPTPMQSAIRTDGGQRDTLLAENVLYRCTSQGLKLKLNNRAENNVIVDVIKPRAYLALREGPMTGAVIKRNIFYHSSGGNCTFIEEEPKGSRGRDPALAKDAETDYNLYWCVANPELSRAALEKNQRNGVDLHSLAADPLFVDPAHGDFRFKPNSPAAKLGIIPIDLSEVGLRGTPGQSKEADRVP